MQNYISRDLTHFVGRSKRNDDERYELLLMIYRNGVLLDPQYLNRRATPIFHFDIESDSGNLRRENYYSEPQFEAHPHAAVDANEFVAPEIVCFCDIPLDQLRIHTSKYSRFGFAFEKSFLIGQGANPVWYVAKNARTLMKLVSDGEFADFFEGDFESETRGAFLDRMKERLLAMDRRESARIQKVLLSYVRGQHDPSQFRELIVRHVDLMIGLFAYIFGYVKTFDPSLPDNNPNNYYMEREWRVVGRVQFTPADLSRVLLPKAYVQRFRKDGSGFQGEIHAL